MDLTAILDDVVAVPRPFRNAAARVLGLTEAGRIYDSIKQSREAIPEQLLHRLAVTYRVSEGDLKHIPRTGPVVVVANHPFGILEGAVLATVLSRIRPDVRFLANEILSAVPELNDLLIRVDPNGEQSTSRNASGLRKALELLENGGCLVVFPAGEVSHFQWQGGPSESRWNTSVARVVGKLTARSVAVSVVPIFIRGSNSFLFHALGLVHPRLRTMLLARELLNKRNRVVELRIGSAIAGKKLIEIPTAQGQTEYLRWRTLVLAKRPDFKTQTSVPIVRRQQSEVEIAPSVGLEEISGEIAALGPEHFLAKAGDLEVYIASANLIPSTLREIGRLREITFRAAGEGTGKALDLDRFDDHYLHLFAWNPVRQEIGGAYRLAGTDVTKDLYTKTLFQYGDAFLDRIGAALELGRSFIRPEYQRGFAPLLALWKGIGAYIRRNPRYTTLFGAVSISNRYQAVSRELMVSFLERHASLRDWMGLIRNRSSFWRRGTTSLPSSGLDVEQLSAVVSDLEPTRSGIPVLLRQYLKLGGKLLGFNVDREFSDALDGLILVDLTKTEPRLLERYLGKGKL